MFTSNLVCLMTFMVTRYMNKRIPSATGMILEMPDSNSVFKSVLFVPCEIYNWRQKSFQSRDCFSNIHALELKNIYTAPVMFCLFNKIKLPGQNPSVNPCFVYQPSLVSAYLKLRFKLCHLHE